MRRGGSGDKGSGGYSDDSDRHDSDRRSLGLEQCQAAVLPIRPMDIAIMGVCMIDMRVCEQGVYRMDIAGCVYASRVCIGWTLRRVCMQPGCV